MSEPCQNLQKDLSNVLQDLISMSSDVIKKSNLQLSAVEELDLATFENVSSTIKTLLERINSNIHSFEETLEASINKYKSTCDQNISEKRLSLNGDSQSQETDIDLTKSDEESTPAETHQNKSSEKKENDDSMSDTDSEKTVRNFDVPVTNGSPGKLSNSCENSDDEFLKALDEWGKTADEIQVKEPIKSSSETLSFDFDDVDDGVSTPHKQSPKCSFTSDTPSDKIENAQKENHELLDLLTKVIGEEQYHLATEEDAEEALRLLEDDVSFLSDSDIDETDSESNEEWRASRRSWKDDESDSDAVLAESESEEEEEESESEEFQLKELNIVINGKVDELNEAEIDRLCDLNSLNKRKCVKTLKKHKKRKRTRIRVLSSSSSSSSDVSSFGSTTPDLVIDTQPSSPPPNIQLPDISALADELADKLENEDLEISSLSSSDSEVEKPEEKKKTKNIPTNDDVEEIKSDEEPQPKKQKKRGTWRDELFFGTSSSESETDDPVIVLNNKDPLEEKMNEDDNSKDKLKLKVVDDGITMIIADSDSNSDSDDVTFVDEVVDDSAGRGRRNIRAILSDDQLNELTQKAKNEEDERIQLLEEHSQIIESFHSQHESFVLDVDVKSGAPLITVDYGLAQILKPHQKDGVKFMWEACYGNVEIMKKNHGSGCILAHCMGLGKTLQVITLIHTLFNHAVTNTKHVLIICPLSTVTNWSNEFKQAFRKLNEHSLIRRFFIVKGDVVEKIRNIKMWHDTNGVLVMGYETFQILTNEKLASRVTALQKTQVYEALINPGPDLIVCDEGHQLKNEKTLRTKALMKVKTKRRIVLTGTPLQNNLMEYYYMVEFVKPHLLGTSKEYSNRFATPIENGQYHNSTDDDIKLMKKRTHVLTKLLKKTIHRVEAGVLSSYLPEIVDYTIFMKLSPLQMKLYEMYLNLVKSQNTDLAKGFFNDVIMVGVNNLHPYAIELYYQSNSRSKKPKKRKDAVADDDVQEVTTNETRVGLDWFKPFLPDDVSTNVTYSPKIKLILDIVTESIRIGDKILIFAQKLVELDLLEHFFKVSLSWRSNVDYFRMDGRTNIDHRDQLCKNFNSNQSVKVFLLTNRVGGLGLNLIGANRVIMIGSNYNPSLDTQSMYRVYRFGQAKKCYVYRLLSLATMEEKIYRRCVIKLHLSGTVVDKYHFTKKVVSTDLEEMYKIDFSEYELPRPIPIVPTDKLLASVLQDTIDIYRYHPHNSLMENRPEEELTDEDKKLAWDEFNSMDEAARTNASNLVPNPMNNNTRGFLPRALMTNGMRPSFPPRMPPSHTPHVNNPFSRPSLAQNNNLLRPSHRQVLEEWARRKLNRALSDGEIFQSLRDNISNVMRNPSREVPTTDEAASGGEFNYALNKVV